MASFLPRATFPSQLSLPRSYFLGHHAAGLSKMKTMLSSIDLIIECRDYRVPLTSRNPLFEQSLAGRERLVIYTKRDLGSKDRASDRRVCSIQLLDLSSVLARVGVDNRIEANMNIGRGKKSSAPGTLHILHSSRTTNRRRTSRLSSILRKTTLLPDIPSSDQGSWLWVCRMWENRRC
jgi:hypothetical protein